MPGQGSILGSFSARRASLTRIIIHVWSTKTAHEERMKGVDPESGQHETFSAEYLLMALQSRHYCPALGDIHFGYPGCRFQYYLRSISIKCALLLSACHAVRRYDLWLRRST
ncbi:hypothetical protein BDDG_04660 [Blastomyces dermatitidis ATCC 18188]|uniref:Uncharacterized protein n=1 Tax=Ajellomyces dermatitidis (strain ATCC 18188 / CBS 674.68) TaxID=653446 RepID=F2TET2_AJEDA|nr:hypothetical protein BDDG_04660 [Blastomyces dermatitidis ATCC 18188]